MDSSSDKLWSFQDLRNASNTWNMKGDKALLDILQNIHNVRNFLNIMCYFRQKNCQFRHIVTKLFI